MVSASVPLPRRVLLKGFDAQSRPIAVEWLKDHSIEVVNILKLADLVVAGPEAEPALLQKARVDGPKISVGTNCAPLSELPTPAMPDSTGWQKTRRIPPTTPFCSRR
jgi:hypothetical protein